MHPFGVPETDDVDFFVGVGLARVENSLRYGIRSNPEIFDYAPVTKTNTTGSVGILPFRRIGIASGGESFGFLLEF